MLRNIQEVLAETRVSGSGRFYHNKGSYPAAANRLQGVADQFPLYSQADEALWELADSYPRMGDRFETKAGECLHPHRARTIRLSRTWTRPSSG